MEETHRIKKFFKKVVAGCDFGYTNPMVCLVVGLDSDDRFFVIDEFYEKRVVFDIFLNVCEDFRKKYGIEAFYCDPSEPMLIQQMNNFGLNAISAENEIIPGINKIYSMLEEAGDGEPRLFVDKKCVNTIMEFEQYSYADTKDGKPLKDVPLDVFNHSLDSLRYIVNSLGAGEMVLLPDDHGAFF